MPDAEDRASTTHITELRGLLQALADENKEVSIRLHADDRSWTDHYANVLVFCSHAILLAHMPTRTVINIPDLKHIRAFEIDRPYKLFKAFNRYTVHHEPEEMQTTGGERTSYAKQSF
jgi:hypothetical protein